VVPDPGRTVRFTGTFLKMIRYAASDGARRAPLIVGDRPPQLAPADSESASSAADGIPRAIGGHGPNGSGVPGSAWSSTSWVLGLVALTLLAAGMLARHHLRGVRRPERLATQDGNLDEKIADPPLLFIDPADEFPV
jgi:hypothetical protein